MDPETLLARLRERVRTLLLDNREEYVDTEECIEALADFDALDRWISGGGFLPSDWQKGRTP